MSWKERNRRGFKGIESNFVLYSDFLLRGFPLYASKDFGDFIDILIDL